MGGLIILLQLKFCHPTNLYTKTCRITNFCEASTIDIIRITWIGNAYRLICHYTCLLQFNAGILLQGSPLHAIFGALFVSLFLMPPQLKYDHYALQSWYKVLQLLFTF